MINSRVGAAGLLLVFALATFLAVGSTTRAQQQQSKQQAACIVGVNKAIRGVAKAQGKYNGACLAAASKAFDPAVIDSCVLADLGGKVGKARSKTEKRVTKSCTVAPDFGFTDAATANGAAVGQEIVLMRDLFGDVIGDAVIPVDVDPGGARCQKLVQKHAEKIVQAHMKEFEGCKKRGLSDGTVTSQAELAACLDAIQTDAKGKIGRTVVKLADVVAKSCAGVDMPAAFPGSCQPPAFADCVGDRVTCRTCLLLDEADDTGAFCDTFDNGSADGSCVDPRRCGNGVLEPGEGCDDGNEIDGDCCAADCAAEPPGGACADDGNGCTNDVCDGAGACAHPNNNDACDDGLFCNGGDTCSGGACSVHAGDPCSGGAECADACDETNDDCFEPPGTSCTDDGNDCTDDECDGAGACVPIVKALGEPCTDDGDVCTDDTCDGAGGCSHVESGACKYVSPTGGGTACTQALPCSLAGGLSQVGAGFEARMDQGTYALSDELTSIASDITLVGGFDSGSGWSQTAGCAASHIARDASNPDGAVDVDQRIVAVQLDSKTGFRVECLRISTADATGTGGMSTYGVHLTNSSNYVFTDVTIDAGNAAAGAGGSAGSTGANGATGLTARRAWPTGRARDRAEPAATAAESVQVAAQRLRA